MSCQHVYARGKRLGQQCTVKPKSGNRCWRHPEKKIDSINLDNDPVFSAGGPGTKPKQEKVHHSVWNITINSNKTYESMTESQKSDFKDFADYLFDTTTTRRFLTDAKAGDNIIELKCEKYFEVGDNQHRLHLHGQIMLTHRGHFRLETNKIREFAHRALGYPIHLNAPVGSDHVRAYSEYMAKKANAEQVKL